MPGERGGTIRNARWHAPFIPPKHPQRNMGNPRGTL